MSLCPPTFRAERVFCVIPTLATPRSASLRLGTSGATGLFLAMTTRPCKLILRLHRTPYATPQRPTCRVSAASTTRNLENAATTVARQNGLRKSAPRRLARFGRAGDLITLSSSESWTGCCGSEFA